MLSERADVRAYLSMIATWDGPSVIDLDPPVARQMGREAGAQIEAPPRDLPRKDIAIPSRADHQIPARLYQPNVPEGAAPIIIFYHGGGWVLGDVEGYDSLCSEIAFLSGITLLSIDYRLAPEFPFPAAVEDALDAAGWAVDNPDVLGHAVSGLILAGDSAGGALAAIVANDMASEAGLLAQWLIYPVADLSRDYPSDLEFSPMFGITPQSRDDFYRHYLGDDFATKVKDPHVSPLFGQSRKGLPPALIMTCSLDPLRDQGRALAAKFVRDGIRTIFYEAEGQVHGSFTMRQLLPSARSDLMQGISALNHLLEGVLGDERVPGLSKGQVQTDRVPL